MFVAVPMGGASLDLSTASMSFPRPMRSVGDAGMCPLDTAKRRMLRTRAIVRLIVRAAMWSVSASLPFPTVRVLACSFARSSKTRAAVTAASGTSPKNGLTCLL